MNNDTPKKKKKYFFFFDVVNVSLDEVGLALELDLL